MEGPWAYLTDLCLLAIFNHVPLVDVIRSVGGVCQHWARLQITELNRRRLLVLVQGEPHEYHAIREHLNLYGNELIERVRREDGSPWAPLRSVSELRFESLRVPGRDLNQHYASSLMRTMDNVTELIVVQRNLTDEAAIEVLNQISRLLKYWKGSLVSVKIDFYTQSASVYGSIHYESHAQVRAELEPHVDFFLYSLNQCQVLRFLQLNVTFDALTLRATMPILRRLDTFSVENIGNGLWLLGLLGDNADTDGGKPQICWSPLVALNDLHGRVEGRVAAKFTRLRLQNRIRAHLDDYAAMRMFSNRFSSLTTLSLYIHNMSMTMLTRALAPLKQLVHLDLVFRSIIREEQLFPDNPEEEEQHNQLFWYLDEEDEFEIIMTPLPSVRLLTLEFNTLSHDDTERFYPDELFPNLQVLDLRHRPERCDVCNYHWNTVNSVANRTMTEDQYEEMRFLIEECMHQAREPFRRCLNLHTVKIRPVGDLLPQGIIEDMRDI